MENKETFEQYIDRNYGDGFVGFSYGVKTRHIADVHRNYIKQERQRIIDWLEKRCEQNCIINGTDKWNEDMQDLITHLKELD